ncbi:MAG TPA: hypothetical protein PLV58_01535 [Campylobacterales bacterium]|nr:hypothetical protein [Campylobacterales bacterium]
MFARFNGSIFFVSAILAVSGVCAVDDLRDLKDRDCKKTSFEKRVYYGLEKIEDLTPAQKESINQALKEFQLKKDKQMGVNVKKFQSDDMQKEQFRSLASDNSDIELNGRESLLNSIHKTLTPKQREQFLKKFQGMMN